MDFKELHLFVFLFNQAILRKQKRFFIKHSVLLEKITSLMYHKNYVLGYSRMGDKLVIYLKYYKFKHVFYKLQFFSYKKRPVFHKAISLVKNSIYLTNVGLLFSEDSVKKGGLHLFQINF